MMKPIYLDYAATTPTAPEVANAMADCLTVEGNFGNAASRSHMFGWQAEEAVEHARLELASLLNADAREIVWTSGATEASNLALKGVVEAKLAETESPSRAGFESPSRVGIESPSRVVKRDSLRIVTTSIEHKSVLDTCAYLQSRGVEVVYLAPETEGNVDVAKLIEAINADTVLVSVMHANNETGSINDISTIGSACRERSVLFHVDGAQTVGKLDIDVKAMNIDLLSISAHKFYGPKGVGALFVRRSHDVVVKQQMHGGGHERGMRSGTLPTHQIVGLGKAAELAREKMESQAKSILKLRAQFIDELSSMACVSINGRAEQQLPGIVNLAFDGIDGESLLMSLRGLAISSGSACMSATIEPSYVLTAMGLSESLADSSLRFSFGAYTSEKDISSAVESIRSAVTTLSRHTA